jgi:hypothetical protein
MALSGIFWSPAFYAQHIRPGGNGKTGFGLLALACLAILTIKALLATGFLFALFEGTRTISEKLPSFYVKEGLLQVEAEQPYRIQETFGDETIELLIDTTRESFTEEEIRAEAKEKSLLLVVSSKNFYMYEKDADKLDTESFAGAPDFAMTQDMYHGLFTKLLVFVLILGGITTFLLLWLGHIVLALLLAIAGQAAKPRLFATSQYNDLLRVASYSLVPLAIILALVPFKLGAVAYTLIALLHYLLVLQLAKRGTQQAA